MLKQPEINQGIFYLTALIQNNVDKWEQKSKSALNEKLFFGKVMGMAKKVTLKAVERRNGRILEIFQHYLDEFDDLENEFNSEIDSNDETDEENNENNWQLKNPIKKPKKGRPKGTKRIRSAMEPSKSNKNKRHCKICKQAGHYSSTCPQNQNK